MKIPLLAAMLGVGGLLVSGCTPGGGSADVRAAAAVTPLGTIRSQGDLQRYLAATANSGSPLGALTIGARTRFLSSVTFNQKGITGFHYGDLQSELTASQIFDVLGLFGAERDVAIIPNVRVETAADRRAIKVFQLADPGSGTDYKGYWCSSPSTCTIKNDSICMSSC
jgi:hypothetical protein